MNEGGKKIFMVIMLALGSITSAALIFMPSVQSLQDMIAKDTETLVAYQDLLSRRQSFEADWAEKKKYFHQGTSAEEILNSWQKSLMAYAHSASFALDKLEPLRMSKDELSVFLCFPGDMKKFVKFIYYLIESDPLVTVKSVTVKQEESTKNFSFEMMLARVIQ